MREALELWYILTPLLTFLKRVKEFFVAEGTGSTERLISSGNRLSNNNITGMILYASVIQPSKSNPMYFEDMVLLTIAGYFVRARSL